MGILRERLGDFRESSSSRVKQILHQVNSLYANLKRAIIFDDSRLGLENKFFPNKITQYERGLTNLKKKKTFQRDGVLRHRHLKFFVLYV